MRAIVVTMGALVLGGCTAMIEPGHRGLLFDPSRGGLQREVLVPGRHPVGVYGRLDDFDVTYSTRNVALHTLTAEAITVDLKVSVIFRPIVSELYELDVQIGPNYYDEVVAPELLVATRNVFARHSVLDVGKANEKIEDEIEAEIRGRIAGKHIEISSVILDEARLPPEVATAIRRKLVDQQAASRHEPVLECSPDHQEDP
jgi:regulator of protease activity HflC (stomatin/prohibitin superfamily)